MRFKIFGITVFIAKDIGKILRKSTSAEKVEVVNNIPKVTVLDPFYSNYVWGFVKGTYHSKKVVKSLIPSILMFRDSYQDIRGIKPRLFLCKEFIESKVIKIDYQYELFETYYKHLEKIYSKGEKNA